MNNKQYELSWNKYDWRTFEKICFAYIKEIYSAKFYSTKLTRAQKDQGRDIIIKSYHEKFVAWGECKYHTRNVDLSNIGKNIVLALSHQINKAIFFSVSSITLNSKIEILNVAQRFGFEVLFLDGNELNKTILSCEKIARKYFRAEYVKYCKKESGKIWVNTFLSEYPYAEDAKNNIKLQYHLKNGFQVFLHIFMKNMHSECISDIRISLSDYDKTKLNFYKADFELDGMITPYADLLYTFPGLVFSPDRNIALPCVQIKYTLIDGTIEETVFETGEIDASDVWKAPYINSDSADFLVQAANMLERDVVENYVRILFLYGNSGMGKSRLMTEVQDKAYDLGYRVIHVDFRTKNEKECMYDFIKGLLGLPSSKRKMKIDFQEFKKIFVEQHLDLSSIDKIYNFLYEENSSISYTELTDTIINILMFATARGGILIGMDNIQEVTRGIQLLMWNVLEHCKTVSIPVCFLFAHNTERMPEAQNILIDYLKISGENRENYVLPQHCSLLSKTDAAMLMQQLLHLVPDSQHCLEQLFDQIETCPMDILLLAKSLVQSDRLFKTTDSFRYIINPKEFIKKAANISESTEELVKNRLLYLNDDPRACKYHELFSLINFFDSNLPSEIFDACGLDRDLLIKSNQHLITKVNYLENTICFYHEKVYSYFQKQAITLPAYMLDTIYELYSNDINEKIVSAYIYLKVLIARKEYQAAITTGLNVIREYKQTNQNQNLCKTCDLLQQIRDIKFHPKEYFYVLFNKADMLLERVNISEAEALFEEAREIVDTKYKFLDQQDIIHFNHRYINQKLHTLQFNQGLDALKKFEQLELNDFKTDMIINDRYCVAYYGLGRETEALQRIDYVIQKAKEAKDYTWLSIGYSDKAFTCFYNNKNIAQICDNFTNAVRYYRLSGETDNISREIEILMQEAICYLLKDEDESALESIQKSINIAEEIIYGYLLVPVLNVHAFLLLKRMDIDMAHTIFKKALSYGNSFSNKKALISIYNNLGNMYIIKEEYEQAMEYYQAGLEILKSICVPENSFRYMGLLCNIVKASIILEDEPRAKALLEKYPMFCDLKIYYDKCKRCTEEGDTAHVFSFSYGVLGLKGFDYLH